MIKFHNHRYIQIDYELLSGHTRVIRYTPDSFHTAAATVCKDFFAGGLTVEEAKSALDCMARVHEVTKPKQRRSMLGRLVDAICGGR